MIVCKNLWCKYRGTQVIKGISFEVSKGEIFGLLGPNGAGKTTTLSLLSGLKQPSSGKIAIGGFESSDHLDEIKKIIGYVPQSFAFYPSLTGLENLRFFCGIYQIFGKKADQRMQHVLEVVGLSERAKDIVSTYSGGMKRRLNIAIGLLHEPEILLLDEPTAGVDPQSRNSIFECINQLSDNGTTVIYTSHYMEEIEHLCTRVAILDQGEIIAMNTPKKLCESIGGTFFRIDIQGKNKTLFADHLSKMDCADEVCMKDSRLEISSREPKEALRFFLSASNQFEIDISSLQISEPSLETVFLKLTGKGLRDEEN